MLPPVPFQAAYRIRSACRPPPDAHPTSMEHVSGFSRRRQRNNVFLFYHHTGPERKPQNQPNSRFVLYFTIFLKHNRRAKVLPSRIWIHLQNSEIKVPHINHSGFYHEFQMGKGFCSVGSPVAGGDRMTLKDLYRGKYAPIESIIFALTR